MNGPDLSIFDVIEPLDPAFDDYVDEIVPGLVALRHPLVFSIPHNEMMNAWCNRSLEQKTKQVEKALVDLDVARYVFLHERPYRLEVFLRDPWTSLPEDERAEMLRSIWIDSENIWQNLRTWKRILRETSPVFFMTEEEGAEMIGLGDEIEIWRGHQANNADGLSWTLDPDKAAWFAARYAKKGQVSRKVVWKTDVFAFVDGRSEREIILKPDFFSKKRAKPV